MRGGPDTLDKLRRHADRTASAWSLDREPLYGVSVYRALDDIGPATLDGILADMHSYRIVHLSTIGALLEGGFELLATASRPYFTVRLVECADEELAKLLALFGEPSEESEGRHQNFLRRRNSPVDSSLLPALA